MASPPDDLTEDTSDDGPTSILSNTVPASFLSELQSGLGSVGDGNIGSSNSPVQNTTFVGLNHAFEITTQQHSQCQPKVVCKYRDLHVNLYKLCNEKLASLFRIFLNFLSKFRRQRDLSITTIITSTGNRFRIKTDLLIKNSDYFATMLRSPSPWIESQQGVVRMAETNKDAFCIYGIWLEMGEIQVERVLGLSALLRTSVYVGNEESIGKEWVKMAKLELLLECYILGDYLQAPFGFQDRVMSHVIEAFGDVYAWSDGKVPLGNLRDIWEKTYPGTPPRDLIIDMLSSCLSKATISDAFKLGILCEDMITAVKERLKSHIRDGTTAAPPWNTYSSRYFMYARSSPAPSTMKKNGLIVAVLPYWDVEGSELRLPDGSKW